MRLETGNKTTSTENIVSIQLKLGGHCFSVPSLSPEIRAGECNVVFEVLTHKVTLVPAAEFDESLAAGYLDAVGLSCDSGETAIWCMPAPDMVAVVAMDSAALEEIRAVFGDRASFSTPLLKNCDLTRRAIYLHVTDDVCYMAYVCNGLELAEAIRIDSADDILFYMHRLTQILGAGDDLPIRISGEKTVGKLLNRYFRGVECA